VTLLTLSFQLVGNLLVLLHLLDLHLLQMREQAIDLVDDVRHAQLHAVNAAHGVLEVIAAHLSRSGVLLAFLLLIADLERVLLRLGHSLLLEVFELLGDVLARLGDITNQAQLLHLVQPMVRVLVVAREQRLDLHIRVALLLQQASPRAVVELVLAGHLVALQHLLDVHDSIATQVHLVHHLAVVQLQVVGQHELGLRLGHLLLDLGVRVVYDGHEHVQQDEESDEDKAQEVEGSEDGEECAQSDEIKITEQQTEQGEQGLEEVLVVRDGLAEEQIAKRTVRKEHNEEDDNEVEDVAGGSLQGRVQLIERAIQRDILEDLDPGEEDHDGTRLVEQLLTVGQRVEVLKLGGVAQQRVEQHGDLDGSVQVERDSHIRQAEDEPIDEVVRVLEVAAAGEANVDDLLERVVDGEDDEQDLHGGDGEVQRAHVAKQLGRTHGPRVEHATGCWELHYQSI
jgi:hypothetical protein